MTKAQLYPKFENELENETKENILHFLFDLFDSTILEELLEHIENEHNT
jgi:hypothetical protein